MNITWDQSLFMKAWPNVLKYILFHEILNFNISMKLHIYQEQHLLANVLERDDVEPAPHVRSS